MITRQEVRAWVGTVDTSSRYRQGDCLREKGPLFAWPQTLSIWVQPSTLCSSFQFPVSSPHFQFRFQPCEDVAQEARGPSGGSWRQEAGEEEGPAVLAYARAHLSNIDKPYLPYLEQESAPPLPRLTGRSSAGKKVRQGQARRRASSVNQSSFNFGGGQSRSVNPSVCLSAPPSASGCDYLVHKNLGTAACLLLERQSPHRVRSERDRFLFLATANNRSTATHLDYLTAYQGTCSLFGRLSSVTLFDILIRSHMHSSSSAPLPRASSFFKAWTNRHDGAMGLHVSLRVGWEQYTIHHVRTLHRVGPLTHPSEPFLTSWRPDSVAHLSFHTPSSSPLPSWVRGRCKST